MALTRTLPAAFVAMALCGCPQPEAACGGAGVICRLAGTGQLAFNGDGLSAIHSDLYQVSSVRIGPDGRVWLMDFNNHRLRVIEQDGTLSTVAGNGLHLGATPGVPATESPLENPSDFGFGPDGTVYLVAWHDPRVLSVEVDGVLRVVAGVGEKGDAGDGGPALDAWFSELTNIAVAGDGTIYVSDHEAQRVRRVWPDGIVEAVAGTGEPGYSGDGGDARSATMRRPEGLALSADGVLYVAEVKNHVIRRIGPDGAATTFAGTGVAGFDGDGGPATAAMLDEPAGVALGPHGDLFIADRENDRVRRVDASGTIATVAGSGAHGLAGDGGSALSATLNRPVGVSVSNQRLFIADQGNSCARVVQLVAP